MASTHVRIRMKEAEFLLPPLRCALPVPSQPVLLPALTTATGSDGFSKC